MYATSSADMVLLPIEVAKTLEQVFRRKREMTSEEILSMATQIQAMPRFSRLAKGGEEYTYVNPDLLEGPAPNDRDDDGILILTLGLPSDSFVLVQVPQEELEIPQEMMEI